MCRLKSTRTVHCRAHENAKEGTFACTLQVHCNVISNGTCVQQGLVFMYFKGTSKGWFVTQPSTGMVLAGSHVDVLQNVALERLGADLNVRKRYTTR